MGCFRSCTILMPAGGGTVAGAGSSLACSACDTQAELRSMLRMHGAVPFARHAEGLAHLYALWDPLLPLLPCRPSACCRFPASPHTRCLPAHTSHHLPTLCNLLEVGAGEGGVGVDHDVQQARRVHQEQRRLCGEGRQREGRRGGMGQGEGEGRRNRSGCEPARRARTTCRSARPVL